MVTSCCENVAWRKLLTSSFASFSGDLCSVSKSTARRSYATTSNQAEDNSDIYYDLKWPKSKFPTPYDLFGIDNRTDGQNIDPKVMKKRYHEYARLYHPDVSQNIRIIRSPIDQMQLDKNLLTVDEKLHRFKVTTQAYQILTDPKKKRLYDFTQSGWPYGPAGAASTTPAAQYPGSHGYRSDHVYAYWNAGTWEDAQTNSEKQPFDAWVLFMWLCGFVICIQATALLTRIEDSLTRQNYTHEETEHDLLQSYTNYGLDTDKISRWRRFLWFRAYGLYRSNTDLDREARRNEEMVQDILKKSEQSEKPVSEMTRPQ